MKRHLLGRSLALGVLLAQVAGLLHVAMAPHQLCREHGELVEPGPGADSAAAAAETDATPALRSSDADVARWVDPSHEHCVVAARHRDQAPLSGGSQASLPVPVSSAPSAEPVEPPPSRIAGWQVAPKQGPPAA